MVQVETEDGQITEVTDREGMEQTIWDNIHRKRFFLAEQAPICAGDLREKFGYNAITGAAKQVLEGTYNPRPAEDPATLEVFSAIAENRREVPPNSVRTHIHYTEWQKYWLRAREDTSSSESGLHFGHYKAGARSDIISHVHAVKTSIALTRGFGLSRWSRGLSVMLEKIRGCALINKLRSILLMEADFNCANKLLYGSRMLNVVREHGRMPEEIFSECNRMADDGTLAKVLFYDVVRQARRPAGLSSVDADNCYDRIAHAIASLVFQSFGVTGEAATAMLHTIQEMKFFLRTAFGDSAEAAGATFEIKTQGLCQGNGAAPAGWAVISITILQAHKKKGHVASFVCPISLIRGELAAILYVDDTDVIHVNLQEEETSETAHERLQQSVLSWGNLLIATGGSLKPSKCFYHFISFKFDRDGNWSYANNEMDERFRLVIPQPDDTVAPIEHLPVNAAHKTLGSMTCPTGDCSAAIDQMREKANSWIDRAKNAKLSRRY